MKDIAPIEPVEIEEMNIEELIVEQFESDTTKLELFDDKKISMALDSYVGKQEARAINEALEKLLGKQQNRLIKNGAASLSEVLTESEDIKEEKIDDRGARKIKKSVVRGRNGDVENQDYEDGNEGIEDDSPVVESRSFKKPSQRSTGLKKRVTPSHDYSDSNSQYDQEYSKAKLKSKPRVAPSRTGRGRGCKAAVNYEENEEDDHIQVVHTPPSNRHKVNTYRTRASKKPIDSVDASDDIIDYENISDKDDPSPQKIRRGRGRTPVASSIKTRTASRRVRGSIESSGGLSQSQLSFKPIKRKASNEPKMKSKRNVRSRGAPYKNDDSDSGDSFTLKVRSYESDGDDWGSAY